MGDLGELTRSILRSVESWMSEVDPSYVVRDNVACIYRFGSRVYGTARSDSDHDVIVVIRAPFAGYLPTTEVTLSVSFPHVKNDLLDVSLIYLDDFAQLVREYRHEAMEAIFAPPQHKLIERVVFSFALPPAPAPPSSRSSTSQCIVETKKRYPGPPDKDVLRRTVLHESLRRFAIARHKDDRNRSRPPRPRHDDAPRSSSMAVRKDVVHSLRYLMFATQILSHGAIVDFTAANEDHQRMLNTIDSPLNWEAWKLRREELIFAFRDAGGPFVRLNTRAECLRRVQRLLRDKENRVLCKSVDAQQRLHVDLDDPVHLDSHSSTMEEASPMRTLLAHVRSCGSVEAFASKHSRWLRAKRIPSGTDAHHSLYHLCCNAFEPSMPRYVWNTCRSLVIEESTRRGDPTSSDGEDDEEHPRGDGGDDGHGLMKHHPREEQSATFPTTAMHRIVCASFAKASAISPHSPKHVLSHVNTLLRGEEAETSSPTRGAKIYQAIDGVKVSMFHHKGKWRLCTDHECQSPMHSTGRPWEIGNADDDVQQEDLNEEFWRIWHDRGYALPRECEDHAEMSPMDCCYTFVVATRKQRYLCVCEDEDVHLVSAMHLSTLKEVPVEPIATSMGWRSCALVDRRGIARLRDVFASLEMASPFEDAGVFIVSFHPLQRYRVMPPQRASLLLQRPGSHAFMLNLSYAVNDATYLWIARSNLWALLQCHFPSIAEKGLHVRQKYQEHCQEVQDLWDEIKNLPLSRFGAAANGLWYRRTLFRLRKESWLSVRECYGLMSVTEYANAKQKRVDRIKNESKRKKKLKAKETKT